MSALGTAAGLVLTRVRSRALARKLAGRPPVTTPVLVYFADAPGSLYQLRRWYRVLEALAETHATGILTSDPSTYEIVRTETTLPVSFATGVPQLTRVLDAQGVELVLYPNHNALNFRVLRFAKPMHVFIGHGSSGKESSVSRQLKAYDRTFVADAAAVDQLRSIRGYDVDANAVIIGSPWLGFLGAPPPSWIADDRTTVLYAPTWEGDRPTMDYSSVETFGPAIVDAVLGSPSLRLIYRPHPWLGRVRTATAAADARLRRAIAAAGRDDVVDTAVYGWSLAASDVCVTDVSSVVSDAQALAKPVLIAAELDTTDPKTLRGLIESATSRGGAASSPSVSMAPLVAAVAEARKIARDSTL